MHLKYRSNQKELLDGDAIATKDLYQNLKELDFINKHLGGYIASRKGFIRLIRENKVKTLMDIGFGGGDSIKQLAILAKKKKNDVFFYGVDLKQDCVNYAEENLSALANKKLICNDYRNISKELLNDIDLIHCSLFLHHLTNDEIIGLFHFARENKCMILANDLHRNVLAYYSIKWLTALFSKSYLVKNDAAVSVTRGFRKNELLDLLKQSGFKDYSVTWSWAFRYIIIAKS
ncbi:SAM-dependent methyltransferase [Sphingobacteriaceae bacterium]|nr:SAM-dependent methyltransferase [Sphingobacteriaceae bacterium]